MLIASNVDLAVSNDELYHIFGIYGDVKEVTLFLMWFPSIMKCFWGLNVWKLFFGCRFGASQIEINKDWSSFMIVEMQRLLFMPWLGAALLGSRLNLNQPILEEWKSNIKLTTSNFFPCLPMLIVRNDLKVSFMLSSLQYITVPL